MATAGQRNRYVRIERDTGTGVDAANSTVPDWTVFCREWVSIKDLMGKELEQAKQRVATATIEVELRYHEGITSQMRIIDGSRTLNIEAVLDPENRKAEMKLLCSEAK